MMDKIVGWIQAHGEGLGRPKLPGDKPVSSLAIPMMTLCIIDQMKTMDSSLCYDYLTQWALQDALKHVQVTRNTLSGSIISVISLCVVLSVSVCSSVSLCV